MSHPPRLTVTSIFFFYFSSLFRNNWKIGTVLFNKAECPVPGQETFPFELFVPEEDGPSKSCWRCSPVDMFNPWLGLFTSRETLPLLDVPPCEIDCTVGGIHVSLFPERENEGQSRGGEFLFILLLREKGRGES